MNSHYVTVIAYAAILVVTNRLYFVLMAKIKNGTNRDIRKLMLGFAQSGIVLSTICVVVGYLEKIRMAEDAKNGLLYVFMAIVAVSTLCEVYIHRKNRLRH